MANTSGTLILDSWAFIEELTSGPKRAAFEARRRAARRLVTVVPALVETHAYIVRRRGPAFAGEWWLAVRESAIVLLEPRLADLEATHDVIPRHVALSMVDVALVWAARSEGTTAIATGDRGFAGVGLDPLFA